MMTLASPGWNELGQSEKEEYNNRAKEMRGVPTSSGTELNQWQSNAMAACAFWEFGTVLKSLKHIINSIIKQLKPKNSKYIENIVLETNVLFAILCFKS